MRGPVRDGNGTVDPPCGATSDLSDQLVDDRVVPGRLQRRVDFLHVGKGRRWHGKALTLQGAPRRRDERRPASPHAPTPDAGCDSPRIGFTLTRKVGCAVIRNRARRRLREAVRLSEQLPVQPDHDYVVVGRIEAIRLPFDTLKRELERAVRAVHAPRPGGDADGKGMDGKRRHGGRGAKSGRVISDRGTSDRGRSDRGKNAGPAKAVLERTRPS